MLTHPELVGIASVSEILDRVMAACRELGVAGRSYGGLIPSILDCRSGTVPHELPPPIHGQRPWDRAFPGSNLMHDHPALHAMFGLAEACGESELSIAADAYLSAFATRCTHTPSGLFPWGEHSYWDLSDGRPGNGFRLAHRATPVLHDHLRQAPEWLWKRLWALDSAAVTRFAHGLDGHWYDGEPLEYNRHAALLAPVRNRERRAFTTDFPRHGGHFIFDWSFVHARVPDSRLRSHIVRMLDYWWSRRHPTGLLPNASIAARGGHGDLPSFGLTLSLAVSLLESAGMLGSCEPELAETMRSRALAYLEACLAVPHEPERGIVLARYDSARPERNEEMPLWGSCYGQPTPAPCGILLVQAARLCGDERPRRLAGRIAEAVLRVPIPADAHIPAGDIGCVLELLSGLAEDERNQGWLDRGLNLARSALDDWFGKEPLPRGASGIQHYESQLQPGILLHGLARLALLSDGKTGLHLDASTR